MPSKSILRARLLPTLCGALLTAALLPADVSAGSPYGPTGLGSNLHRRFVKKQAVQNARRGQSQTRHAGVWIAGGYPQTRTTRVVRHQPTVVYRPTTVSLDQPPVRYDHPVSTQPPVVYQTAGRQLIHPSQPIYVTAPPASVSSGPVVHYVPPHTPQFAPQYGSQPTTRISTPR